MTFNHKYEESEGLQTHDLCFSTLLSSFQNNSQLDCYEGLEDASVSTALAVIGEALSLGL